MELFKTNIKTKDSTLAVQFFKSESSKAAHRPVILTLHAFTGKKENRIIYEIVQKASEHDFDGLCFDFTGHGESTGDITKVNITRQIEETSKTISEIISHRKVILVGNSFSVVTAIAFAKKYPETVKGLVLISGRAHQEINAKYLSEHKEVVPDKFIDEEFIEDYMNYNSINILSTLDIPVVVIHGKKDEVIPLTDAKTLFGASHAKVKELIILNQGGHRFSDKCRTDAVDKIYAFLEKHF